MSETRKRTRSISGELESDGDYEDDNHTIPEDGQAGRPGRKRKSNSQAARRDQNRIAQREFRLRKQQRIRDLEARVELLSGSKDETYLQMRDIIRELISENYTLRTLVRNLSNFIGEGAGGVLPTLGWTLEEFDTFIKKADTDTAFEAFMKHRKTNMGGLKSQLINTDNNHVEQDQNRNQQASSSNSAQVDRHGRTDSLPSNNNSLHYPTAGATPGYTSPSVYSPQSLSILSGIRGSFNSPFMNGLPVHTTSPTNGYPSPSFDFSPQPPPSQPHPQPQPQPQPQSQSQPQPQPQPQAQNLSPTQPTQPQPSMRISDSQRSISSFQAPTPSSSHHVANPLSGVSFPSSTDADNLANHAFGAPAVQDACKLISYHLEHFRRNSAYCLPLSLRPTLIQRTVDHDRLIDGIPHSEIRNRMILFKDRFNLIDCVQKYLKCTDIHGDDVLDHTNWEIHDIWLKEFGFLVDPITLGIVNRWRKERGEREVTMAETCPSGHI